MSDETTTEQLVEIEEQGEQPQPVQVREGRWRTRGGDIKNIRACEPLKGAYYVWPWTDGFMTFQDNGRHLGSKESPNDLVEYLGSIEPQPQPQPQPQPEPVSDAELRIRLLKQANDSQAETIGRLLSEARDLNMEIGGLERRLSERDARIRDLETMHAAATQAVVDAGKANDALRLQVQNQQQEYERQKSRIEFLETLNAANGAAIGDYIAKVAKLQGLVDTARQQLEASATECDSVSTRLEAVAAERDEQAETIRRLRIELDAAQQVPQAVSDRFEEGWDAGTARAVETIAEWTEPFRRCGSERLAWMVMQNLPHIMRTLTGLAQED